MGADGTPELEQSGRTFTKGKRTEEWGKGTAVTRGQQRRPGLPEVTEAGAAAGLTQPPP